MKKDFSNKCKHKLIYGNITMNTIQVDICIYISDEFNLNTFIFYGFPSSISSHTDKQNQKNRSKH